MQNISILKYLKYRKYKYLNDVKLAFNKPCLQLCYTCYLLPLVHTGPNFPFAYFSGRLDH